MFFRIVAWGIAAFVLVSPELSSGEPIAFADVDGPAASSVIATTRDQTQGRIPDQTHDQTNGTPQVTVSAVNPAKQSIKSTAVAGPTIQSPVLTEPFGL